MMKKAKRLLELLENFIPPGENQRHNMVVENGDLLVYLMLGDKYISFTFEQCDFGKEVEDLALEIYREVAKMQNEDKEKQL